MSVVVIEPPAPAVDLDEAKRHLRVDGVDDDAYITGLIATAQSHIDGPGGWLGRAVGRQTLEWSGPGLPLAGLRLPYPEIVEVTAVTFDGDLVSPSSYAVYSGVLSSAEGSAWPLCRQRRDSARVRYVAGYADGEVPPAVRHAILMMVGELYAAREDGSERARERVLLSSERLLAPFRVWS